MWNCLTKAVHQIISETLSDKLKPESFPLSDSISLVGPSLFESCAFNDNNDENFNYQTHKWFRLLNYIKILNSDPHLFLSLGNKTP